MLKLPTRPNSKNVSKYNCVPGDLIPSQKPRKLLQKKQHPIWDAMGPLPIVHCCLGPVHNSILHHNCVETSLCKGTPIKPLASYLSPWPNAEVAKKAATRKQHKAPKYVRTSWLFICIKDLHLDTNKELLKWHCLDQ